MRTSYVNDSFQPSREVKVDLLGNAARTTEDRNQREWELGGGGGGAGGELGEGIMPGMVLGRFGDYYCRQIW